MTLDHCNILLSVINIYNILDITTEIKTSYFDFQPYKISSLRNDRETET